jgi:hypothetical protein
MLSRQGARARSGYVGRELNYPGLDFCVACGIGRDL